MMGKVLSGNLSFKQRAGFSLMQDFASFIPKIIPWTPRKYSLESTRTEFCCQKWYMYHARFNCEYIFRITLLKSHCFEYTFKDSGVLGSK